MDDLQKNGRKMFKVVALDSLSEEQLDKLFPFSGEPHFLEVARTTTEAPVLVSGISHKEMMRLAEDAQLHTRMLNIAPLVVDLQSWGASEKRPIAVCGQGSARQIMIDNLMTAVAANSLPGSRAETLIVGWDAPPSLIDKLPVLIPELREDLDKKPKKKFFSQPKSKKDIFKKKGNQYRQKSFMNRMHQRKI